MVVLLKQITVIWCVCLCMLDSTAANGRVKRILNGVDLPSHALYNTFFLVKLQQTFNCMSDQMDHNLEDCEHYQKCGGSLIQPDFILTACHCITYEEYYAEGVNYPPPRKFSFEELPKFINDRANHKPFDSDEPLVYPKTIVVKHPLLNSMTLFAGHAEGFFSPQRRHAAKFFPHHLCAQRQALRTPQDWDYIEKYYESDYGLVKPCYPFELNNDVWLAPIAPHDQIEEHLRRMLHQSFTCLFVGWGDVLSPQHWWTFEDLLIRGYGTAQTDLLQHSFRTLQCNSECYFDDHRCILCTGSFGKDTSSPEYGDSGGPLICDTFVTGVASRSSFSPSWNHSLTMFAAVACVNDFITDAHLRYLRSTDTESFHWFNGKPMTPPPPTKPKPAPK